MRRGTEKLIHAALRDGCREHCDALIDELRRLAKVEAQRDALLSLLRAELPHAEWRDKIIHPYRGESWQNWKISIWLPVPLSASDKSPQAALDRLVDAAIKQAEENT